MIVVGTAEATQQARTTSCHRTHSENPGLSRCIESGRRRMWLRPNIARRPRLDRSHRRAARRGAGRALSDPWCRGRALHSFPVHEPTTKDAMSLPKIVSQDEWHATAKAFLAREKEVTKIRDALNTDRRQLPMVEVTKDYVFEGGSGTRETFRARRPCWICSKGGASSSSITTCSTRVGRTGAELRGPG